MQQLAVARGHEASGCPLAVVHMRNGFSQTQNSVMSWLCGTGVTAHGCIVLHCWCMHGERSKVKMNAVSGVTATGRHSNRLTPKLAGEVHRASSAEGCMGSETAVIRTT